jgi:hypothetical protein
MKSKEIVTNNVQKMEECGEKIGHFIYTFSFHCEFNMDCRNFICDVV